MTAIRRGAELQAQVPLFESALAHTAAYIDQPHGADITSLLQERYCAQAYTLDPNIFTLRLDRNDTVFSYNDDEDGLLNHGMAGERGHGLILPGHRIELPVSPPYTKGMLLYSTLDIETLRPTHAPRVYIGIGLAALANRVKVWGEKARSQGLNLANAQTLAR